MGCVRQQVVVLGPGGSKGRHLRNWTRRGGLFEDGDSGAGGEVDAHAEEAVGRLDGCECKMVQARHRGASGPTRRPRHPPADAVLQADAPPLLRRLLLLHAPTSSDPPTLMYT